MNEFEFINKTISMHQKLHEQPSYKNANSKTIGLIWHLSIRSIRGAKVCKVLFESKEIENSYIEALPFVRILLESYFHILYITDNVEHPDRILKEYEELESNSQRKMARKLREFDNQLPQKLHRDEIQFMRKYENNKFGEECGHLSNLYELAKAVNQLEYYVRLYTLSSNYVHYNPLTRNSFGKQEGNNLAMNVYENDPKTFEILLRYTTGIHLNIISTLNRYLLNFETDGSLQLYTQELNKLLFEWKTIFDKRHTETS